jgi:hypothetical protein
VAVSGVCFPTFMSAYCKFKAVVRAVGHAEWKWFVGFGFPLKFGYSYFHIIKGNLSDSPWCHGVLPQVNPLSATVLV